MRLHPGADRRCRTGSRERESYFHTIALLGVILHRRVVTGEPFEPSPGWPTVRPDPRLISSSPRRAKRPNAPKQSARRPLPADRERPSAGQWRAWSGQRAGAHVKTAAPRRNQHFAATHRGRARRSLGRVASSGLGFRHERTIRTRGPGGISIQAVRSGKVQGGWGMGGQTANGRGAPVVGRNQRRSTPPVAIRGSGAFTPLAVAIVLRSARARAEAIAGDHASGRSRLVAAVVSEDVVARGGRGSRGCGAPRCSVPLAGRGALDGVGSGAPR
jgi:hypothetical protein